MTPVLPLFGCRRPRRQDGCLDLCPGGGTKFQPVYVGDVADAVVAGLLDRRTDGRIYELGGPTVYSFREVMQLVLRQTRRRRLLLPVRSEEHTSELQSLMRISYAVFCLKKKTHIKNTKKQ